jgi:hypothetical protein
MHMFAYLLISKYNCIQLQSVSGYLCHQDYDPVQTQLHQCRDIKYIILQVDGIVIYVGYSRVHG